MTLLSIIVPVYNAENYLKDCIHSILNQSFKDFELILIDDGSTDSSGNICDNSKLIDKRIKVFHQSNEGPADARNKGIELSQGKYIGFCDSDDILLPKYYEHLIKNIEKEKADISGVSFKSIDEKGNITNINHSGIILKLNNQDGYKAFLQRDRLDIHVWTKIYKKSFLDYYNIRYEVVKGIKIEEDFLFNLKAFLNSRLTIFEDIALYTYLKKETSLSRDYHKHHFRTYLHYSLYRLYKVEKTTNERYPELSIYAKRQTILYMVQILARCSEVNYKNCEPYYSYIMRYLRSNKKQVINERSFWGMSIVGVTLMTHMCPLKYHLYRYIKHKITINK